MKDARASLLLFFCKNSLHAFPKVKKRNYNGYQNLLIYGGKDLTKLLHCYLNSIQLSIGNFI